MTITELFNYRIAKILMQTVSLHQQLQSIALIMKIIYQINIKP
jgi:hypothetical protein